MSKAMNPVPIHEKLTLTVKEAAAYSNIGMNKLDSMLRQPNCPFVLFVGTKKLIKHKEFEQSIRETLILKWAKSEATLGRALFLLKIVGQCDIIRCIKGVYGNTGVPKNLDK